ncbi:hypothetical protein ACIGXA_24820 [Streptomyces fildesensis]|uniref:Uncharacterized protein n=1 Tax=Streptomyces fildesensis TaxID=375757 RepID=A0ABW8CBE3_9ACTN
MLPLYLDGLDVADSFGQVDQAFDCVGPAGIAGPLRRGRAAVGVRE